jgi:putative membrane protein
MNARIIACITATLLAASAMPALAGDTKGDTAAADKGQQFIKEAIQGNLAEQKLGQLAQAKGQSEAVRSYGNSLQKDHATANQDAMKAAQSLGISPPSQPSEKQQAAYNDLAKLSGDKFDDAFVKAMVKDHKKDIKEYEQAAKNSEDPAGTYASHALPTLKMHLQMAQTIDTQMNQRGATRNPAIPDSTNVPRSSGPTTPAAPGAPDSTGLPSPPR